MELVVRYERWPVASRHFGAVGFYSKTIHKGGEFTMYPNQPGGPPPNPEDPTNPPSYSPQVEQPGQYPPPAYNQAPPPQYPQQPQYAQQAPQYPQQPQPKKSKKGWIIGCSIAALVVLLACGGIGVALYIGANKAADAVKSTGQASLASAQVVLLCTAFEAQDYNSAYQRLSTAEQGRVGTPDQFAQRADALDTSAGTVVGCQPTDSPPLASISSDGKSATLKIEVQRSDQTGTSSGTVRLVLENDTWKIDGADNALTLL